MYKVMRRELGDMINIDRVCVMLSPEERRSKYFNEMSGCKN